MGEDPRVFDSLQFKRCRFEQGLYFSRIKFANTTFGLETGQRTSVGPFHTIDVAGKIMPLDRLQPFINGGTFLFDALANLSLVTDQTSSPMFAKLLERAIRASPPPVRKLRPRGRRMR